MTEPFEHEGTTNRRLDRVESDVASLGNAMVEVRGDLRNVSSILSRIEEGIKNRDQQHEQARARKELNPVAVGTAVVSFLSFFVGGAWLIGGTLARLDERDVQRDRQTARIEAHIDALDRRTYDMKGTEQ